MTLLLVIFFVTFCVFCFLDILSLIAANSRTDVREAEEVNY